MKKTLYAGLLAACLSAPAFAASNKFVAQTPDEPIHRRAVLLCVAVLMGLQALRYRPQLPARRHVATAN
ncbi:hypothetical protein GTP56_10000 [Duganella sp. FT134W]|uniref:Uncharacterized protein n=1 Tax=Duganella margarita TaxID=2692170 RepID=A0A7X4H0Q6_9BURK|nr:hypothetical protein [Duganella margarita]MYM72529.1 hypothetical protein [Duganella margarita]